MIKSITLLGSSSGRNAGDAALISGIMQAVDQTLGRKIRYEIPTLYPDFVAKTYSQHDVAPINVMPWTGSLKLLGLPTYKSVTRTDMSLVFDAVLFDRSLFNPMFNFLSSLYFLIPAAKKAGKMAGLYNCGVGPIKTELGAKMLKKVADHCDLITIREQGSVNVLRQIGIPENRINLTADAALNSPSIDSTQAENLISQIGLNPSQEILAININVYLNSWSAHSQQKLSQNEFLEVMSSGINEALREIKAPLILVSTMHKDIELTKALKERIFSSQPLFCIDNKQFDHYQLKGIFSKMALLFAMRLHAIILASSVHTPVAGLAYQPKVTHYFEQLGLVDYCSEFNNFNPQAIKTALTQAWNNRSKIRELLDKKIPDLKSKAISAASLIAQLDSNRETKLSVNAS